MPRRMIHLGLAASVLVFAGLQSAVAEETLESVEKQLVKRVAKIKTMSAKMTTTSERKKEDGFFRTKATGTYEYMKRGDKVRFRTEMEHSGTNKTGGGETDMGASVTTVFDGEHRYSLSERRDRTYAIKATPLSPPILDVKATLEHLRRDHVLSILRDQEVEGRPAYVIRAKATSASARVDKREMYFDKATGVMVKSVMFNKDGEVTSTTLLSDIEINESISASRFVFKAPPGVEVRDVTSIRSRKP